MTEIKLCGLSRTCDIDAVNSLMPNYVGFVFAKKSRRSVSATAARELKKCLHPAIRAVGVFVNENADTVAEYLEEGIIDLAQLHGTEDESYLTCLRLLTGKEIIQAFRITTKQDMLRAEKSTADMILLDSGAGTGKVFDWNLLKGIRRPFFLAGGLDPNNVEEAVRELHPHAVDVSSGIETDGVKDQTKMAAFIAAVRRGEKQ